MITAGTSVALTVHFRSGGGKVGFLNALRAVIPGFIVFGFGLAWHEFGGGPYWATTLGIPILLMMFWLPAGRSETAALRKRMALPPEADDPRPFNGTLQMLTPWKDDPLVINGFACFHDGNAYFWSGHYLFAEASSIKRQDDGSYLIGNGHSTFRLVSDDFKPVDTKEVQVEAGI